MSERRIVGLMARQYADLITDINVFGDMQSSQYITPEGFEGMRQEVLGKIREQRRFLREAEEQVKRLQLPE